MVVRETPFAAVKQFGLDLLYELEYYTLHWMSCCLMMIAAAFWFVGLRCLASRVMSLAQVMPFLCSRFGRVLIWPMILGCYLIVAITKETIICVMGNHISPSDTRPAGCETGGCGNGNFSLCVINLLLGVCSMVQGWFIFKCGYNMMRTVATQLAISNDRSHDQPAAPTSPPIPAQACLGKKQHRSTRTKRQKKTDLPADSSDEGARLTVSQKDLGKVPSSVVPAGNPPREVSSQGEESDQEVTVQPLSWKELRNIRKEFIRQDGESLTTWLLRCWDNGADGIYLSGREAGQLGNMAQEGGIDKGIRRKSKMLNLWRRLLSAVKKSYPFRDDIECRHSKWTTREKAINYLRELAVREVIYGDWRVNVIPDEVPCTQAILRKFARSLPSVYAHTVSRAIQGRLSHDQAPTIDEVISWVYRCLPHRLAGGDV